MSIDDLSAEVLERLGTTRYDRIMEKHEGPFSWESELRHMDGSTDEFMLQIYPDYDPIAETPEFLLVGGQWVLLPVGREQHQNITVLHHFLSEDQQKLVIYLKNTTYYNDAFSAGYVAICDLFAGESFYVATLYHEWFIIDYDGVVK